MQNRFNHDYYFDEAAGKKIKPFEALDVGVPGAAPETPEEVQEEPEVELLLVPILKFNKDAGVELRLDH